MKCITRFRDIPLTRNLEYVICTHKAISLSLCTHDIFWKLPALEWHTQDNMYMYTILYRKSIYKNNYTHGSRPKAVAPINIEHSIKIPIVLRVSLGVSLSLFLTLFSSLSLSISRTLPTLNSIQAPIPMHAMCIILYNKPSYKIFGYRFLRLLFFIY